ncbi:hypothetical protein ES708_02595 [subsurface metagenome]
MRAETKELYPDNWPEISLACIERADRTCKDCGRAAREDPVVLTSHHKDYDPSSSGRLPAPPAQQGRTPHHSNYTSP